MMKCINPLAARRTGRMAVCLYLLSLPLGPIRLSRPLEVPIRYYRRETADPRDLALLCQRSRCSPQKRNGNPGGRTPRSMRAARAPKTATPPRLTATLRRTRPRIQMHRPSPPLQLRPRYRPEALLRMCAPLQHGLRSRRDQVSRGRRRRPRVPSRSSRGGCTSATSSRHHRRSWWCT